MNAHDDQMHEALGAIGKNLPEPTAPARLRERIEAMPCSIPVVQTTWRTRVGMSLLGVAATTLAVLSAVLFVQNERLSRELTVARSGDDNAPAIVNAALPPLVAMNFYHPQCPVAGEVMPKFEQMKASHCANSVLFLNVDVSENMEPQAAMLTDAIGCNFVYSCDQAPEIKSGTVVLADMRNKKVLKMCSGAADIGEVEKALNEALITCRNQP